MSDVVNVPAEKIAALRHHLRVNDNVGGTNSPGSWRQEIVDAARAVVDAVETEDDAMAEDRAMHAWDTSPARDDAECTCPPPWNNDHTPNPLCPVDGDRTKLTHAERARLSQAVETDEGTSDIHAVAYAVEHILANRAHMAAPDKLTALRADREILNELTALADVWREYAERPDCADSLTYRAASDWIMHILAGNSHAALPYFLGDALDESGDA